MMKVISTILGLGLFVGCSVSRYQFTDVKESKYAALQVTRVEDAGGVYHADFRYENRSARRVLLLQNEIHCFRGGAEGGMTIANESEIISIGPREARNFEFECRFQTAGTGAYRLRIDSVYEEPRKTGDSEVGRRIVSDLEWDSEDER